MTYNKQITDYIYRASDEHIEILETVRRLVHETIPNVTEAIKWKIPIFASGKDFAYLRFSKNHITLGFYNADKIIDPDNILEGEGNTLKHIKIKKLVDYKPDIIAVWLRQITDSN